MCQCTSMSHVLLIFIADGGDSLCRRILRWISSRVDRSSSSPVGIAFDSRHPPRTEMAVESAMFSVDSFSIDSRAFLQISLHFVDRQSQRITFVTTRSSCSKDDSLFSWKWFHLSQTELGTRTTRFSIRIQSDSLRTRSRSLSVQFAFQSTNIPRTTRTVSPSDSIAQTRCRTDSNQDREQISRALFSIGQIGDRHFDWREIRSIDDCLATSMGTRQRSGNVFLSHSAIVSHSCLEILLDHSRTIVWWISNHLRWNSCSLARWLHSTLGLCRLEVRLWTASSRRRRRCFHCSTWILRCGHAGSVPSGMYSTRPWSSRLPWTLPERTASLSNPSPTAEETPRVLSQSDLCSNSSTTSRYIAFRMAQKWTAPSRLSPPISTLTPASIKDRYRDSREGWK